MRIPFLTAHWRHLVMVNYAVDPTILLPLTPAGTELDTWRGVCLVSMVGFMFDETKVFGCIPIPLHASFPEVNLRFYLKRRVGGETRRGVAFIKELVPSRSVTWVARTLFHENYQRAPMQRKIELANPSRPDEGGQYSYEWHQNGSWSRLSGRTTGQLAELAEGSIEQFITEHYWGYSGGGDRRTIEYEVEHPSWRVWQAEHIRFEADVETLYGRGFVEPLSATPHSALVAEGSPVRLYYGRRLT